MNTQTLPLTQENSTVGDYITLLKPGVMSLVVFTGFVGMAVAPGHLHPMLQIITVMCIAIGSGAGGAMNMWFDRDIDALMLRTAARPIPTGRITPENALSFGVILSIVSVSLLGLAVNWLAAGILLFAIFFYVAIYTMWLKRRTPQNIVIGGAAGAFPPVIGWAAVTGNVTIEPLILFLIIFMWTPPHFWALALYRNSDYAKAGVPMMPVVRGKRETKKQMMAYTLGLVITTLLPYAIGMSGLFYALSATALGTLFMRHAWLTYYDDSDRSPRRMFLFSILYLFVLFGVLTLDSMGAALLSRFGSIF